MIRTIIKIDPALCNGCGACARACHEGAIGMVDGKAVLLREDYCDGLGDCLPACPTGAISFEKREAAAYNEEAVKAAQQKSKQAAPLPCGCPGSQAKTISHTKAPVSQTSAPLESQLSQWPVQLSLVPINAPYFNGAHLLIAADCTAYAYADFHNRFIRNRITLISCPKLDSDPYTEKLTAIFSQNDIQSVTIVRMEVPCCGKIVQTVKSALAASGKMIPWQIHTVKTDGTLIEF